MQSSYCSKCTENTLWSESSEGWRCTSCKRFTKKRTHKETQVWIDSLKKCIEKLMEIDGITLNNEVLK